MIETLFSLAYFVTFMAATIGCRLVAHWWVGFRGKFGSPFWPLASFFIVITALLEAFGSPWLPKTRFADSGILELFVMSMAMQLGSVVADAITGKRERDIWQTGQTE